MEFKGTKGQWVQNGINGIHTPSGNCIATTHMNKHITGDETRLHDAKLIASAPELLEALQFCVDRLNWNDSKSHEAYAMANTAINKALHP